MQGTGVPADKQPAAADQRPQLRKVEFPEVDDAIRRRAELDPRRRCDSRGGLTVRRPRAEHDATGRRRAGKAGDKRRKGWFGPPPERISGAHVHDHQLVLSGDPERLQPFGHSSLGGPIRRHLDRIALPVGPAAGPALNRLEQIPLIHDRVARSQLAWTRHATGVHPGASGDLIADPLRRPGEKRQPRASWSPVQVENHVVAGAAQPPGEPCVGRNPRQAGWPGRHDHFIDISIARDDRRRLGLDEIRDVRFRKNPLQGPRNRRGEDDVADQAQTDEKDLHVQGAASGIRYEVRCFDTRRPARRRFIRILASPLRIPDPAD